MVIIFGLRISRSTPEATCLALSPNTVWLSPHLKPPVVFIVLDHIHEVASQRFQEIGRVHVCLDL